MALPKIICVGDTLVLELSCELIIRYITTYVGEHIYVYDNVLEYEVSTRAHE